MVDPRDDLSAMDFARKLVILSRECGLVLSLEGISIHSLVEKELENLYVKDFLAKLRFKNGQSLSRCKKRWNSFVFYW